jgi:hypothetical protein
MTTESINTWFRLTRGCLILILKSLIYKLMLLNYLEKLKLEQIEPHKVVYFSFLAI